MTLKSVLKVVLDTRYRITAHHTESDTYTIVELDYLKPQSVFSEALHQELALAQTKNKVTFISYNKAAQCMEIDIEIPD